MLSTVGKLWCVDCGKHTTPEVSPEGDESPFGGVWCSGCDEQYACPRCGWDVDGDGTCLRTEDGAGVCPSNRSECALCIDGSAVPHDGGNGHRPHCTCDFCF